MPSKAPVKPLAERMLDAETRAGQCPGFLKKLNQP